MASPRFRRSRTPFQRYAAYVAQIGRLMSAPASAVRWVLQTDAALNGEASAQLRKLASLAARRRFGAFFTGTALSARLLNKSRASGPAVTYDPTCGMGDLLVATARLLPLGKDLNATLQSWGAQLAGTDLHSEFVTGTKTRLVLLARQRHKQTDSHPVLSLDRLFPLIRVGDGLRLKKAYRAADRLLMNPPFGQKKAPRGCRWAEGKMSRAAEFIIHALEHMQPGAELLAILPDVLRSGTFSRKWRERVGELAEVHFVKACGLFDENADVDVFLLRLVRREMSKEAPRKLWPRARRRTSSRIEQHFTVSVGRVVPHRDLETGPLCPYIHPRGVPAWETVRSFAEYRRHHADPFPAPFVVIRRTSRPEHPYRATGSIIAGKQKVAVENHFLVCTPNDGTVRSCKRLLQQLKLPRVNQSLNKRIRCRHLTVGAVREVPYSAARAKPAPGR